MFTCVAYRTANDGFKVHRFVDSKLDNAVYYDSLDELPEDIQTTIKQMLWVNPDDHSMTASLGVRVGENTFWLL